MPIQPFIFVGVGGTGGKTIGVVRKMLDDTLSRIGWDEGWPDGWQFIHVDVPADPDADAADTPYSLPRTSYVPLTNNRSTYTGFHEGISSGLAKAVADPEERYLAWDCWHPEPPSAVHVHIPNGAGQYRGIGRVCVLNSLKLVDQAVTRAVDSASSALASPQLRRVQQLLEGRMPSAGNVKPVIFVIGSVAGGSGSGMFLDVCDVIRGQGHKEIIGVLFAPEVFQKPTGETEPGVAPNTFMALSELSNAMWTHAHADAPISRDRMFGRAGVRYPVGRGGPSTVFLVGRRNRAVTFDNADDVYKIVGRSLGELALQEELTTNVIAYDIANGHAVATGKSDALELSPPDEARDVAPFRALGFSRLTVGRDFFDRYSSDRLLRRVALRLLDGHLEGRRADDPSSDEELRQKAIKEAWPAFERDSELDEVGEADCISNVLYTWKQPEVESARHMFEANLRDGITNTPKRDVVTAEAHGIAAQAVAAALDWQSGFSQAIRDASRRLALVFQQQVQQNLELIVRRSIAANGLPVAIGLMDNLIEMARAGLYSLGSEREHVVRRLQDAQQALPQPPAGSPAKFPVGSVDDIQRVVDNASQVLWRRTQEESKLLAAELLEDLTVNLLEPWRRALSDADGLLRMELRPAIGKSPLDLWPGEDGIPDYLRPSKVEFLLDDVDGFPEQFVDVIERSVDGAAGKAAVTKAVEQIIAGEELGVHARSKPVAVMEQSWSPRAEIARPAGASRAQARVTLTLELDHLKGRTHEWLTDQEKFAGQVLKQSMGDYLTDPQTSAPELRSRQNRMVGHFEAMIKASLPLIGLDSDMMNLVHGRDVPEYNLHVSPLNVPDQLDELRGQLQDTAVALLNSQQRIRFTNNPRADATMMTLLSGSYHMLEISSVMDPIAQQWSKGGPVRDLWQYRRARPLGEWVPLGPGARKDLIAGWFAARLIGKAKAGGAENTELYVDVDGVFQSIPNKGIRPPSPRDHIGMLLEALPAAMLECYQTKSLTALAPYQVLINLGSTLDREQNAVSQWVQGTGESGAPELDAGLDRLDAARGLIGDWVVSYREFPELANTVAESQAHPTREVLADVLESLDRLQAAATRRRRGGTY